MKLIPKLFVIATALLLAVHAPVVSGDGKLKPKRKVFFTLASGAQEVTEPPGGVVTRTLGKLILIFDPFLTRAKFKLHVFKGRKITQAHLHCAPAGLNGSVAAFLFDTAPVRGPGGVNVQGKLSSGVLTNAEILPVNSTNCGVVNNIASLYEAVLQRRIYLNVHSEGNPSGEVRGQVMH